MASGAVVGAEALLRWPHLTRGLVSPLEFVPLAEESGLIVPIGEWVLHEACRQAAEWRARLPPGRRSSCRSTCRAASSRPQDFSVTVREALALAGLPAEHLVLELTESVLMTDDEASREQLATLRAGLGLAIDDFGTGYSSLAYLQQFPVTALKIDRSFVAGLDGGVTDSAVARAVLQIGRTLGLDVVAEGVERPGQAAALQRLDCQHAQGFLYSKPVPPEEFVHLLRAAPLGLPAQRDDRRTPV